MPSAITISDQSVARQNDTTNSTLSGARIETGWGVMTITSGTATYNETVTYGTAFTTAPIVVVCAGGDSTTAQGSTYGTGANTVAAIWYCKSGLITTTNFNVKMDTASVGANGFVFYQWFAIGV